MILIVIWTEKLKLTIQRTVATTIIILLSSSFTSFIQILFAGIYRIDEILIFGGLSFFSSYFIAGKIKNFIDRTKKQSVLPLILIIIMLIALPLIPVGKYYDYQ